MKTTITPVKRQRRGVSFEFAYQYKGEDMTSVIHCKNKGAAYVQCCHLLLSLIGFKLDELYNELCVAKPHYYNNSLPLYIHSTAWTAAFWKFIAAREGFHRHRTPEKAINEITSRYFDSVQPDPRIPNAKKCCALLADLKRAVSLFNESQKKYRSWVERN